MNSPIKLNMLLALAKYKFLTNSHFLVLGFTPSLRTTQQYTTQLINAGYVKNVEYGNLIKKDDPFKDIKNEGLNFLTKKGVEFLEDRMAYDKEDIKYPPHQDVGTGDYIHRVFIIFTLISYDKYCTLNNVKTDFKVDYHKHETLVLFKDKDVIKKIIFDIVIIYKEKLYVIEVWQGKDKDYIMRKIKRLYKPLLEGYASSKFEYSKIPRMLHVFRYENIMEDIRGEILSNSYYSEGVKAGLFHFAHIDAINKNFGVWQNINGKQIEIRDF
jgi:hypothetical protein